MELRDYFAVIRRRWMVVALVAAVAAIVAAGLSLRGSRAYEATMRVAVSIGAPDLGEVPPYPYTKEYYLWLSAEYLADDLSEIVKSDSFIADIRATLDPSVQPFVIREVLRAKKTHRILEITVQAATPEQALTIAGAIAKVMQTQGKKYLAQLATPGGQVFVIDQPVVRAATTTGSQAVDLGLRVAVGLLLGLFLAFVTEFFDSRLRSTRNIEQALSLPILAEIPVGRR